MLVNLDMNQLKALCSLTLTLIVNRRSTICVIMRLKKETQMVCVVKKTNVILNATMEEVKSCQTLVFVNAMNIQVILMSSVMLNVRLLFQAQLMVRIIQLLL